MLCCAPVVTGTNMLRVSHIFYLNNPVTSVSVDEEANKNPDSTGWEFVVKGRQKAIIFIAE